MRKIIYFIILIALCFSQHAHAFMPGGVPSDASSCSYPLPLGSDTVAAAYSFRKLSSSYAGNAVQLTRASDSTTLNVGFSGCNFNTSSATTFCAATTCTITEWYDQSGNGNNLTPGVAPGYNGSCQNSQPCATFDGSTQYLIGTLATGISADTFAAVAEITNTSLSSNIMSIGQNISGSGNATDIGYSVSSSACDDLRVISGTTYKGYEVCSINTQYRIGGTNNGTLSRSFVSGTAGTDNTTSLSLVAETAAIMGGEITASGPTTYGALWPGMIEEVIIFAPDISSTDYGTVSSNQATYWSVP